MTDTPPPDPEQAAKAALATMTPGPWHCASVGPYPYTANVYGNPDIAPGIVARCDRSEDA